MNRNMLPSSPRSRMRSGKSRNQRRQLRHRRLMIETLEDRRVLSIVLSPSWEYQTPSAYSLAVSETGDYVVAGAASGAVYGFDVTSTAETPSASFDSFEIAQAETSSTYAPSQRKLAVTSDQHLHVVYHRKDSGGVQQIFHAESADGGETWAEQQLTFGAGNKIYPALAVDSNDVLHLVYQGANHATYYMRKTSGWQAAEWVASYATTPAIAVDGNDHVHVVYGVHISEGFWIGGNGIRWRVRTSAGWQPEQSISSNKYWTWNPAIAIDANNHVHVAWNHAPRPIYYDTHYRVRTPTGWGIEVQVNAEANNEWAGTPSIAIDSSNHAHIVWHHRFDGNSTIKYRKHSGVLEPTVDIVAPTPYVQRAPVVSLDGAGRVHVLWHGQHLTSPTTYQLRHRQFGAAWEPVEDLTTSATRNQIGVSALFANHPQVAGRKTNIAGEGYSFIWMDDTTIRYAAVRGSAFPEFGINQWWATAGVDEPISVTWTTEVTEQNQYFVDIYIEYPNSWKLIEGAQVTFDGQTAYFNESLYDDLHKKKYFYKYRANLGELTPGIYQFEISSFAVPDTPVVEEITFQLSFGWLGLVRSDSLTALFVADHAETNLPSSFRIQDAGLCEELSSVHELVDHFAPVLFFSEKERYAMPFDMQISLGADQSARTPDRIQVMGDADDYLDLLPLATGEWPRESYQPKVYASVLECTEQHALCVKGQGLAINYWLHYPRSNWGQHEGYNTHEGDWEGATLFLKLKDDVWVPDRVAFAQHLEIAGGGVGHQSDGGDVMDWERLIRNGSQPHWYVGLGGHATYGYSETTTWLVPSLTFPWRWQYDESHYGDGETFDSQGYVDYLPRVGDSRAPSWLQYPGFWGNPAKEDGNSPRGPVFQSLAQVLPSRRNVKAGERWLDPWAWSDGFSPPAKVIRADEFGVNVDNDIVLTRTGEYIVVTVDAVPVFNTTVAGSTDPLMIYGQTGNDTLTIDFSNGNALPLGGLTFVGGDGIGNQFDTLVVANGVFQDVVKTFTSPHAGTIQLDGQPPIAYVGLAPVDFIGDQIANLTIHLPAGADQAVIEDAGDVGDGLWRIRSADSPPTFELTTFPSPSNSLTIHANGDDTVTISALDSLFSTPHITFSGSGGNNRFVLDAAERLPDTAALTLTGDVQFDLNGYAETIGSLSDSDDSDAGTSVSLGSGSLVTGGNHTSTTYAGTISGAGGLTKAGNGVLRLTGAIEVGTTTVGAGALLVQDTLTAAQTVRVNSGGTLGGTGTVASIASPAVQISSGGMLDPGDLDAITAVPQPGRLTVVGDVVFLPGSTFNVQVYGLGAGTGYDQLQVNGAVDLSGTVAGVDGSLLTGTTGVLPVGGEFRIIDNLGAAPVATRFDGLPEGAFLTALGPLMSISYAGGTGNDVVLTIPGRFDFNGFHGYTAPNYTGISPFTLKSGANSAGWQSLPPRYFERNWPIAPPYTNNPDGQLKYDGHETDRMGSPMTFEVDVVAGLAYEVMILTGDTLWNHDRQEFRVWGSGFDPGSTQVIDTWGAGAPDGSGANVIWGGGTPNTTAGYYRWVRFTTEEIGVHVGDVGKLYVTIRDLAGWDATAVILGMDIRPVGMVGEITIVPPAATLAADGVNVDTYTGSGAPPNTVLTVTAFAPNTLTLPANNSHYLKIERDVAAPEPTDLDLTLFGTQILSDASGNFRFRALRPTLPTPVTFTVQEPSGLYRGTLVQEYVMPPAAAALRFDFGVSNSPVQEGWLQVHPRITYNATRGYGWTTRVAAVDRQPGDGWSAMRRDLNYAGQGTFRVDLPNGTYSVRIYHANPRYYGRHHTVHDNFRVTLGDRQYTVDRIEPGASYVWSGAVTVSGGSLIIHLQNLGGVDGNFIISGLEISAGTLPVETALQAAGDPLSVHDSSAFRSPSSAPGSLRNEWFADLVQDDREDFLAEILEPGADSLLAARPAKSAERAADTRVPRRSRLERYKHEWDHWFAELGILELGTTADGENAGDAEA